jgi:phosphohistidine phosphatase
MCEMLEAVDDQYEKVMIVGHNPALTSLLNTLCDASIFNMPTSAVAIIGFDMDSWKSIEEESGALLGYGFPKSTEDFKAGARD